MMHHLRFWFHKTFSSLLRSNANWNPFVRLAWHHRILFCTFFVHCKATRMEELISNFRNHAGATDGSRRIWFQLWSIDWWMKVASADFTTKLTFGWGFLSKIPIISLNVHRYANSGFPFGSKIDLRLQQVILHTVMCIPPIFPNSQTNYNP